jgi:hypothetical protein
MTQDEDFKTLFNYIDFFLADWLLRTLEYKMTKSKLSIIAAAGFKKKNQFQIYKFLESTLETIYPEWRHYILSSGPPDHVSFW